MPKFDDPWKCLSNLLLFFFKYLSMNIWGFLSAAVLLTLMPGPDILFVITQSITGGRRAGIIFAAGLCTGLIVHIAAVALGLSVLLASSPVAFSVLKFAGAAYLVYLGVRTFVGRSHNKISFTKRAGVVSRLYRKGILMNVLNPKVALFFLAFFPQFVDPSVTAPVLQMLLLGLVFMVQAFCIFSLVAVLAERLSRKLMQNPQISLFMNTTEAVIYWIIGVGIAFF